MLTSISPLGERARGHDARVSVALYTVASGVGGLTTAALLGAAGRLLAVPHAAWWGAGACALAVLLDLTGHVPTGHRQVDEDWLTRYRRGVYATGFGWQLGTGVLTIVTSAATYAWLVLLVLQGSLPAALAVGLTFGLVRALPLLLLRADTPVRLRSAAARIEAGAATMTRLTAGVLAVGAVCLVSA